jgi:hypothetical protein
VKGGRGSTRCDVSHQLNQPSQNSPIALMKEGLRVVRRLPAVDGLHCGNDSLVVVKRGEPVPAETVIRVGVVPLRD